jgi:hypothetical protein
VVEKPDTGIGCVDTYHEAFELIDYLSCDDKAYIHAAYLQAIGVGDFNCVTNSTRSEGPS